MVGYLIGSFRAGKNSQVFQKGNWGCGDLGNKRGKERA